MARIGFEHPTKLPVEQIPTRLQGFIDRLLSWGLVVNWQSPTVMAFKGNIQGIETDGTATITPGKVVVEAKDPGMLMRSVAKAYLAKTLATYLKE